MKFGQVPIQSIVWNGGECRYALKDVVGEVETVDDGGEEEGTKVVVAKDVLGEIEMVDEDDNVVDGEGSWCDVMCNIVFSRFLLVHASSY